MIEIANKLRFKNIKTLYGIKSIENDGSILVENRKVIIYNVEPINIINTDNEFRLKVFSSYLACIKNFKDIQIIIKTEKKNFNNQIDFYKNRILQVESIELKKAIRKYIEYLDKQEEIENYLKKIYIVVNESDTPSTNEMENLSNTLYEIGVKVKKINDVDEIREILRAFIKKERNETVR